MTATSRLTAAVILVATLLTACQASSADDIVAGEGQATASPRPQPSFTVTQQPAPPEPVVWVTVGAPARLSIPKIGVDAAVYVHTDEMIAEYEQTSDKTGVYPLYPDQIAWWPGGGVPGGGVQDGSGDTAYLYGHTSADTMVPAVFNRLKELVVGDTMMITDENNEWLGCVVEDAYIVPKTALSTDPRVVESVPGRVLLFACWRDSGAELVTTDNLVVQVSCGVL